MRTYLHLLCQEQPYVSHQIPQKVFMLVFAQGYSNCYMGPKLANKYSWQHIGSVPILLTENQKSKVCQALMYMQHRHATYLSPTVLIGQFWAHIKIGLSLS